MDIDADFAAAFSEAVEEPQGDVAPEVTAEPEVVEVAEGVEDAAVEQEAVEPAGEPASEEPVAEVVEPEPVAPTQQQIDPAALAAAIADEQARRAQAPQVEQPTEPEAPKPAAYEDYLDDSQKKSLELFIAEWPDVAAPVAALIAAHVSAALANQRQEILGTVQQQMAPIQQETARSQEAAYYATIQAQHPDFREVAAALPEWIENQPFRNAQKYMEQFHSKNPADAVALLSAYKQAKGSTDAAPANPASSAVQAAPKAAPVSPAAVAATLAPPAARRSSATKSRDPNDEASAFAEAFG
ncbi:hypothetical protein [Pseudomonas sp.]|uniref:hypothetical protein n=1 Tax=Pseudomonas sp. TaxID=306 RepID=UPI00258665D4|nr:hypothetical protein [Pseudomonas sp.]